MDEMMDNFFICGCHPSMKSIDKDNGCHTWTQPKSQDVTKIFYVISPNREKCQLNTCLRTYKPWDNEILLWYWEGWSSLPIFNLIYKLLKYLAALFDDALHWWWTSCIIPLVFRKIFWLFLTLFPKNPETNGTLFESPTYVSVSINFLLTLLPTFSDIRQQIL